MKSLRKLSWILLVLGGIIQDVSAAGVAVTKEQAFHSDQSAKPFVFDRMKDFGRYVRFEIGVTTLNIEQTGLLNYIEVITALPESITGPEQITPIRKSVAEIEAFISRYPLSEPILRENLASLKRVLQAYDSGLVLYEHRWITAAEFQPIKEQLALRAKQEQERLAAAAQAKKDELARLEKAVEQDLAKNSLADAEYRIRERDDNGAFIEIMGPEKSPDTAYLEEPAPYSRVGNAISKGTLYYSGSYLLRSSFGTSRMIRTYHRSRDVALSHLRDQTYGSSTNRTVVARSTEATTQIARSYEPGFQAPVGLVWVNGYFRADGTWVQGHYRNAPDENPVAKTYTPVAPYYSGGGSGGSVGGPVHVRGYTRKDGTYVRPHTRRR